MKRALFRSLIAMGAMVAFYTVVLSLLGGGIDFPIQQFRTFWMYLVPLVLSYGGLVFVSTLAGPVASLHPARRLPSKPRSRRSAGSPLAPPVQSRNIMVGTPTSAASMVACCAHHIADFVPLASVFSAASFLVQYQTWLMVGAVGVNIVLIFRLAIRLKRPGPGVHQGQALS